VAEAEMVVRPFASGTDSSGATDFRRMPELKKEKLASTLHEIIAAN
jgi:hypothetical protein